MAFSSGPHAPVPSHEIPLSRPDITDLEIDLVVRTLRSGRLALGPMAEQFEKVVASHADCEFGVSVSNGTCGLHMALLALGIGPGDEVITTPFSFIASSNCILYVGAKPVFVDICPKTLNMDPERLEAAITGRTKAIIAVETFGNPAYMDAYAQIAQRHEIPLIEDCCEALGSRLRGRPAGSFGRIGVFAFYPNKQITTGEGGCIVTNDRRLANVCRSLRNQGRAVADPAASPGGASGGSNGTGGGGSGGLSNGGGGAGALGGASSGSAGFTSGGVGNWLAHERLGFNYRLDEMSAALGLGQMKRLDEIIHKRQDVARHYIERLMHVEHLIVPTLSPGVDMSWFVFVVRLDSAYTRAERDRIITGLRRHDIGASDYFPCIHLQPFYRERFGFAPGSFPIAESVSQRTIALPFYNDLPEKDLEIVCQTLEHMIARENLSR